MTTLYLARHGRSVGRGLFLGRSDPGLSEEGREQSRALAEGLAGAGVERILCSTLRRSRETAEEVAERLGLPVEADARWDEIGYGLWDGLSWDEIERRWPEQAQRKLESWWSVTPEGGEAREAFHERVREAWEAVRLRGGSAVLVGHAGVNALVNELSAGRGAVDWERVTRFQQEYGDFLRISVS
jgi:broad specificity phosphatase PhoE